MARRDAVAAIPAVTFFEGLGRGWRTASSWPPEGTTVRELFAGPAGTLLSEQPDVGGEDVYRVDPTVGLAALPWDWTTPTPAVPPDISPDDHRAVTWTTPPLDADLLITGNPAVVVVLALRSAGRPVACLAERRVAERVSRR